MKKVLIVEDEHITREMLVQSARILFGDAEIHSTATLDDALSVVDDHSPIDTILLDLRIPGAVGMSGLADIRKKARKACIIVWTGSFVAEDAPAALRAGANGFLPKTRFHLSELADAIREIENGQKLSFIEPDAEAGIKRTYTGLTPRENEIYELICLGMKNRQIADKLGTTERYIKQVRQNLRNKLGDPAHND